MSATRIEWCDVEMSAGKKILRVFPRATSYTPRDELTWIGEPGLFAPHVDEVHVSVCFTWDVQTARHLASVWRNHCPVVRIGGPAIDGELSEPFTPGLYIKKGITITSRGCPNRCAFCLVRQPLKEFPIQPGHVIQDNNILATRKAHFHSVIAMLNSQTKAANFRGGLEAARLSDWHAEQLRRLRNIHELWFACDTDSALPALRKAVGKLSWLPRRKLRCYVLCGFKQQTIDAACNRLEEVWEAGCFPFAQLYRPVKAQRIYEFPPWNKQWRDLSRKWSRPAMMFAMHKENNGKSTDPPGKMPRTSEMLLNRLSPESEGHY